MLKIKFSLLLLSLFVLDGCTACSDNHDKNEIEKACMELDDR